MDALLAETRATLRIALPLIAGQIAVIGEGVAGMVLAGHLGAQVLGVVAVGVNIWGLGVMTMVGVMMAVSPSVAQLDGRGRRSEIGPLFRQAIWLAIGLGLVVQGLVYFGGPALVHAMDVDPNLQPGVTVFLRTISFSAIPLAVFLVCRGLSEGLELPRASMCFSLLGLALLVPIGFVLMYQLGWGAYGAALATTIVCWLQAICCLSFISNSPLYRALGWEHPRRGPDMAAIAALLRLGVPMAVSVMLEVGLFSGAALLIGRFGSAAIASHQIALNVASVTFMVPLGIAMAVTVRVGHAVGRHDHEGAHRAGLVGIVLALLAQAIACTVLLSIPLTIAGLYTDDPAVRSAAAGLLFLAALFQLSDGLQVVSNGALRGLKDARLPMFITLFAYWVIGMPTGWLLAFPLHQRTPGMWIGLIAGLSCAAVLLFSRFLILSRRRIRVLA